ncbi:MAG: RnfABCDGE type electron transport complex subunit D [Clostridia bacterium]|nr:RnfABCDGE type electron transport complex subunit D [Clostridia bacterium]
MMEKLIVSYAPHIRTHRTTQRLMLDVIIALIPSLIASIVFFGIKSLFLVLTTVASCVLFEFAWQKIFKNDITVCDLSAVVTGILLAFNMPVSAPLWMGVVGGAFAIIIVKMCFGGLGNNFVNPALAARAFLLLSWPVNMTKWTPTVFVSKAAQGGADVITGATPLGVLKETGKISFDYMDMFLGNISGCIGEVSTLAIVIGFIYLLVKKVITWHVPVIYVASVFIFAELMGENGLFYILSGGLMLGAVFMATDYVTSPMSLKGNIIYAFCLGLLTVVIRKFGALPEGVSYSILLMNIVTPLIDNVTKNRYYGKAKKSKEAKQ